jgi:hypothetical protein
VTDDPPEVDTDTSQFDGPVFRVVDQPLIGDRRKTPLTMRGGNPGEVRITRIRAASESERRQSHSSVLLRAMVDVGSVSSRCFPVPSLSLGTGATNVGRQAHVMAADIGLRNQLTYCRTPGKVNCCSGLTVAHTSIWRWTQVYGPEVYQRLQGAVKRKSSTWHMDETFVRISGRRMCLFAPSIAHKPSISTYRNPATGRPPSCS